VSGFLVLLGAGALAAFFSRGARGAPLQANPKPPPQTHPHPASPNQNPHHPPNHLKPPTNVHHPSTPPLALSPTYHIMQLPPNPSSPKQQPLIRPPKPNPPPQTPPPPTHPTTHPVPFRDSEVDRFPPCLEVFPFLSPCADLLRLFYSVLFPPWLSLAVPPNGSGVKPSPRSRPSYQSPFRPPCLPLESHFAEKRDECE